MTSIEKHMLSRFIALRTGVGIAGISLPIILVGVGRLCGVPVAASLSAYYHANRECSRPVCADQGEHSKPCANAEEGRGPMRNWFVGTLFFIGAAMITIKGFSRAEDWALDIAGFMAGAMALVPMGWPCSRGHRLAHFAFSVLFFACVGFTSLFCSDTTLNEMAPGPARTRYKIAYRTLAVAMVGLPVAGWLTAYNSSYETLGFQTGAIWAFGIYWLVKTGELRSSGMEREFSKVNCRWTRIGSPD